MHNGGHRVFSLCITAISVSRGGGKRVFKCKFYFSGFALYALSNKMTYDTNQLTRASAMNTAPIVLSGSFVTNE